MFAGHLLLILFTLGGEYFLLSTATSCYKPRRRRSPSSSPSPISFLELLVQFLQAYVFTLLTAIYIAGALAEEH